jgi:hypothetical protein
MPWVPELFSEPVLERLREKWERDRLDEIPYYDGLVSGELEALVRSFAGQPVLLDPRRGRVIGVPGFERYVDELNAWFTELNMTFDPVGAFEVPGRVVEEVAIHLDGESGRVDVPVAIVADRHPDRRLVELRIYHSSWAVTGDHVHRTPVFQADPAVQPSGVMGDYQRALEAGDVDAIVATFEPDGYAREPAGEPHVHRGHDELRAFYEHMFSNGGGIELKHCGFADDGRSCAVEYNIVRWGTTEMAPEAGVAVYVRGPSGKLAAARVYDDADPPIPATSR